MAGFPVREVALGCHPQTPSAAVRSICARVGRMPDGMLSVTYTLEADFERLRVPASRPPHFTDQLWEHTCCEIFIRCEKRAQYHELDLAPSSEWAVFAFERYREGTPLADEALNPRISARTSAGKLQLNASIPLGRLSSAYPEARLSLGLSAVVEDIDGVLSYWALAHPAGQPDFHHPDAFVLELTSEPAETSSAPVIPARGGYS